MAKFEVRQYDPNDIPPEDANWKLHGTDGNWESVVDPKYGTIEHVTVVQDGVPVFDKIDMALKPGAYALPVRINPQGQAEFLIPLERRILLRNEEGERGNVMIPNVPQVLILEGEEPIDAARRCLTNETGYSEATITPLEEMYFAPSNSSAPMYFFMGIVPYEQQPIGQTLLGDQEIEVKPWMTYQEVRAMRIQDGSTRIALDLVTQLLDPASLSFT